MWISTWSSPRARWRPWAAGSRAGRSRRWWASCEWAGSRPGGATTVASAVPDWSPLPCPLWPGQACEPPRSCGFCAPRIAEVVSVEHYKGWGWNLHVSRTGTLVLSITHPVKNTRVTDDNDEAGQQEPQNEEKFLRAPTPFLQDGAREWGRVVPELPPRTGQGWRQQREAEYPAEGDHQADVLALVNLVVVLVVVDQDVSKEENGKFRSWICCTETKCSLTPFVHFLRKLYFSEWDLFCSIRWVSGLAVLV